MFVKKKATAATVTWKTENSHRSYHKSVNAPRAKFACRSLGWLSRLLLEAADRVRCKGNARQANYLRRLVTEHQKALSGGPAI